MIDADNGLAALRSIMTEFKEFCAAHGNVTEADTRAKVIDRILRDVLGWPEASITREQHADRGYMDYVLTIQGRRYAVVEAKREGRTFVLPKGSENKSLKLSGTLITDKEIKEAIHQVRGYCDDEGIRYGLASNGYTWIVFRAIREDMPWRDGSARVFGSLESIGENFTDFWNLLSYEAISAGSLDTEFGSTLRVSRELHRVIDLLFNSDLPLQRNRLHAQLNPVIKTFFEDIGEQKQVDILQRCYVHTASLQIAAQDLNVIINDALPRFLKDEGAVDLEQTASSAGQFGDAMEDAVLENRGQLLLLLGGIGAGRPRFFVVSNARSARELSTLVRFGFTSISSKRHLMPSKWKSSYGVQSSALC
jgi:hypothetical protein